MYAVDADVQADPRVPDDADVSAALAEALDRVDAIIGPKPADAVTGRKWVLEGLAAARVDALKRATVAVAVELYLDPNALAPAAGGKVSGPDFAVESPTNGSPAGVRALERAARILDANGLRVLTAYAR